MSEDRAKLSLDFEDDEEILQPSREEITRKIQDISEKSGFISKAPVKKTSVKKSAPVRKRRTRAKTGRTYPFNTKIKPETYDLICKIADTSTEKEGRPVSLAEVIERAIECLDTQKK